MSSVPSPTSGGTADMLPQERLKASIDVEELGELFARGFNKDTVAKFREELFSGPVFDDSMSPYWSYEEKFKKQIERTSKAVEIVRENPKFMMAHIARKVQMGQMFQTGGIGIHFSMFLTFLKTNGTPEQQEKWLDLAQEAKFFGAYTQTELGHGSNVRGLETTATLDKETDEFVIHSPTLTSLKWWPTGMYASTHGVVMAQLIVDGKSMGFQGFFVQFRDQNGELMPGVEIGEMGPKINTSHTNIGYARFTHVRIPRFNMFAKFARVERDGTYVPAPPKLEKFKYISMMEIRMFLVGGAFSDLGKASTIAIRYSCVRKQGFKDSQAANPFEAGENVVMDYKLQQYRLFKALGLAYMFFWNSRFTSEYLSRVQAEIQAGNEAAGDELPELHATLAGMKVWSTVWAHMNIEECRKACGGQGFLKSSGVVDLTSNFSEAVTVEGEQVILSLQVARFLIKSVGEVKQGKDVVGSVKYLQEAPAGKVAPSAFAGPCLELAVELLKDRASRIAKKLEAAMTAATAKGLPFDQALNSVAVRAYKASEAHTAFAFARNNIQALPEFVQDPQTRVVLERLLELTCLILIRESAGDFMGVLDDDCVDVIIDRINGLLDEIRPECVALVDSFGFADHELKSTLGRKDGNVYEEIYRQAKLSPLNQSPKMVGWELLGKVVDTDFLAEGKKTQRAGEFATVAPGASGGAAGSGISANPTNSKL